MSPGAINGIYDKTILPEMRLRKDPRLINYWDERIAQEAGAASRSGLTFNADKFNGIQRPRLLWKRAQDMIVIGQKNRAIAEMFALIKGNPSHPDVAEWASQLEKTL